MFEPQKILVLASHTDDGEQGCGGSISKFIAENKEVYYAAFSSCEQSLPEGFPSNTLETECKAAVKKLGIECKNLFIYNYPVRHFKSKRQDILEDITKLKKQIQPDLVLIPSATDMHQDHEVIHKEALRAFKHTTLLGYELPWNNNDFNNTLFINLSTDDIDKKIASIKEYKSQTNRNYMQADFTKGLAKVRGVQANCEYAEAFEVYRFIIK